MPAPQNPPTRVVYGVYPMHDSFALYEERHLADVAADVRLMRSVRTLGELRDLLPALRTLPSPVDPDDLEGEIEEAGTGGKWLLRHCGAVADGDWPPMPTANILRMFGADNPVLTALRQRARCAVAQTNFNGPYLEVPVGSEHTFVDVLREHGMEPRRDDELFRRVFWDG